MRITSFVVKGVLFYPDNRVLILVRSKSDRKFKGTWENPLGLDLPGGSIDPGESLREALYREIKEETELDVSIIGPVNSQLVNLTDGTLRRIDRYWGFLYGDTNPKLNPKEHENFFKLKREEIPEHKLLPTDLKKAIIMAFALQEKYLHQI